MILLCWLDANEDHSLTELDRLGPTASTEPLCRLISLILAHLKSKFSVSKTI
jgi:hypothetical protein